MSYTQNPHMPKVRQAAADMVRRGHTPTEVGRRFGVGSSTICKWVKKAQKHGYHPIPTLSSRPKHHPKELDSSIVWKIFHRRLEIKRCAEVVHESLKLEGVPVSLSSVKRTLDRTGLLNKRSPWKRYHAPTERPEAYKAGDLVQIDTIHLRVGNEKIYVFTLVDLFSRWAYAYAYARSNTGTATLFMRRAQREASFTFSTVQSDHGSEFSQHFSERVKINHRHSRVRKPNDNAHIERFNRTLREECLDTVERDVKKINKALKTYVSHYNTKRLHLGISLRTPIQLLTECVQAIG